MVREKYSLLVNTKDTWNIHSVQKACGSYYLIIVRSINNIFFCKLIHKYRVIEQILSDSCDLVCCQKVIFFLFWVLCNFLWKEHFEKKTWFCVWKEIKCVEFLLKWRHYLWISHQQSKSSHKFIYIPIIIASNSDKIGTRNMLVLLII